MSSRLACRASLRLSPSLCLLRDCHHRRLHKREGKLPHPRRRSPARPSLGLCHRPPASRRQMQQLAAKRRILRRMRATRRCSADTTLAPTRSLGRRLAPRLSRLSPALLARRPQQQLQQVDEEVPRMLRSLYGLSSRDRWSRCSQPLEAEVERSPASTQMQRLQP